MAVIPITQAGGVGDKVPNEEYDMGNVVFSDRNPNIDTPRGVIKVTANGHERTGVALSEYIENNDVVMQGGGAPVCASEAFDGGKVTDLNTPTGQFSFSGRGHIDIAGTGATEFTQPSYDKAGPDVPPELGA